MAFPGLPHWNLRVAAVMCAPKRPERPILRPPDHAGTTACHTPFAFAEALGTADRLLDSCSAVP